MSHSGISRAQPKILFLPFLSLAVLASACGSEAQAPQMRAIPGCEMPDIAPCDARTRECEMSRFELAACLRGAKGGEPPPITLMTEEGYAAYINGSAEGQKLAINHYEVVMTWLGLAQPGSFNFVPVTKESIAD